MMDEIHVERWDWLIKIFDFQDFKHTNIYLTEIVRQANLLLEQLNAGSSLGCVEDINAAVYVTLFEGLCGEKLHGKTTRIKMVESVGEVRWIRSYRHSDVHVLYLESDMTYIGIWTHLRS